MDFATIHSTSPPSPPRPRSEAASELPWLDGLSGDSAEGHGSWGLLLGFWCGFYREAKGTPDGCLGVNAWGSPPNICQMNLGQLYVLVCFAFLFGGGET